MFQSIDITNNFSLLHSWIQFVTSNSTIGKVESLGISLCAWYIYMQDNNVPHRTFHIYTNELKEKPGNMFGFTQAPENEVSCGSMYHLACKQDFIITLCILNIVLYNSLTLWQVWVQISTLPLLLVPICETPKCIHLVLRIHQSLLSFSDNKTKIYTWNTTLTCQFQDQLNVSLLLCWV